MKSYPNDCNCASGAYPPGNCLTPESFQSLLENEFKNDPKVKQFKEVCKRFDHALMEQGKPEEVNFQLADGLDYDKLISILSKTLQIARYDLVREIKSKKAELGIERLENS